MSHGSHGAHDRLAPLAPRSPLYQGPFGRILSELAPWSPPVADADLDDYLLTVAEQRMLERPGATPDDLVAGDTVEQLEAEFSSTIPAGYTYFGQFVDHDITFDPASSLERRNDPNGLLNHRTPRFDLDNVYGRGPTEQPYLYDQSDHDKLLVGTVGDTDLRDLPRNAQGRALIGDMRNDENAIVSQLHLAFLLAHNELVDRARDAGMAEPFETARSSLRWLYQWVVWHDFIRRVVLDDIHACALQLHDADDGICGGRAVWRRGLDGVYNWKHQPFMPVEFSVAAYRFGHSMVRNAYQTNEPHRGFRNFAPIFANVVPMPDGDADDDDNLRGFRPMRRENVIQWDWFLQMTTSMDPFPQRARKIDTKLSNALAFLHEEEPGATRNKLAFRNLKRGYTFDLPSGTSVARRFGLEPVALDDDEPDALWYYILKEAETLPGDGAGQTLGPVGSIIVAATFSGLLAGDPRSWVNMAPRWTPDVDPLLRPGEDNIDDDQWSVAAIVRLAGLPVDRQDVRDQT